MVLIKPKHGAGNQEARHLIAPIIEYARAPLAVLALARVCVFIARLPIEFIQAVGILWEVRRHPVENHADACLMALIDKIHEVVRRTVAGGDRKIAGYLIAPGAVEGMLHHGHELDMRIAHFGEIGDDIVGKLAVIKQIVIGIPPPGARMDFIDIDGTVVDNDLLLLLLPGLVAPFIATQIINFGSSAGARFHMYAVRVAFHQLPAVVSQDAKFIVFKLPQCRHFHLPHTAVIDRQHRILFRVPVIEIAHDADACGMRRPSTKHHFSFVYFMHAKVFVCAGIAALVEQIQWHVGRRALSLRHGGTPHLFYSSIGKQGETAPPGSRKATFAAFSASAGGSQPSPCGLANLPLRCRGGPLEFWGNAGAFGKADDDAFLAGRRGG